ncbi:restriction endonuclease subunit S [Enterococcus sp. AZ192]|uniref:restriction endonuclease subunit S n=1 Tax=unclassified Enterococcus TaxID=2608891 RepID=UPI003D27D47F
MSNQSLTISIKEIIKNHYSLSALDYRAMSNSSESEGIAMIDLITTMEKGFEPGSENYVEESSYKFLRISDLDDDSAVIFLTNEVKNIKSVNLDKQVRKGDILYQTASNVGNVCFYYDEKPAFYNSHLLKLDLKMEDKFYVFAFLKSSFSKTALNVSGSIKGVDNFRKDIIENQKIVFPNKENYKDPNLIKQYVELLMESIIQKEIEIKEKNEQIDAFFSEELNKDSDQFKLNYSYPTKTQFLIDNRLDSHVFSRDYKLIEHNIKQYSDGFFYLDSENISPGRTPKDRIFSEESLPGNYLWLTPKNMKGRLLHYQTYIHTNDGVSLKKDDVVISGIRYVDNGVFISDAGKKVYTNQNTLIIRHSEDRETQIFILLFLTSSVAKELVYSRRIMGTVPILYASQLCKIPIPNFSKVKREKVVELFFNEMPLLKDTDNFKEYLNEANKRNKAMGIYQLNEELLYLRDILNETIGNIVNRKKIVVSLPFTC